MRASEKGCVVNTLSKVSQCLSVSHYPIWFLRLDKREVAFLM